MSFASEIAAFRTPKDLLRKLEHDLQRMKTAVADPYAAFDFFVTADSLVDWLYPEVPGDKGATSGRKHIRSDLRQNDHLVRIASHIANGAKHFIVSPSRHASVVSMRSVHSEEEGRAQEGNAAALHVYVTPAEAAELGVQDSIEGTALAERVLQFWVARVAAA
jgi:hypothetical protein